LGLKKTKKPSEPKTEFGAQNQYGRVIYLSIGNLNGARKNILLGVKEAKINLQSPKTEFRPKISMVV
jgi:hypothetical protein